jgi:hypothetical protein
MALVLGIKINEGFFINHDRVCLDKITHYGVYILKYKGELKKLTKQYPLKLTPEVTIGVCTNIKYSEGVYNIYVEAPHSIIIERDVRYFKKLGLKNA